MKAGSQDDMNREEYHNRQAESSGSKIPKAESPKNEPYLERTYRESFQASDLTFFRILSEQTDLYVGVGDKASDEPVSAAAMKMAEGLARRVMMECRNRLETHIRQTPDFLVSLEPMKMPGGCHPMLAGMYRASASAGVGPMAAVAGAVAEWVGRELAARFSEVLVENGGDLWMAGTRRRTVGLFCGTSPLNGKLGLALSGREFPMGLCTSSGTIGHSLSFGKADAATVKAKDAFLADAVATALGNRVKSVDDIQSALDWGARIKGVTGLLVVVGDRMGAWGDMELALL